MATITYHQPFYLLPNRVWRTYLGGKCLDEIDGRTNPRDSHFPEDWIGSGTRATNPGRRKLKDEGIGKARTIAGETFSMEQVYKTSPRQALGDEHIKAFGEQPQLLVKLLDSAIRLHIQAHPSVSWSRENLKADSGKTEAWWILGSREPNPWVILGFQRPPTSVEWRRIIYNQDLETMMACFDRVPVAPGDVFLIEGGVPHAVGRGLLMLEVQEPTDYAVRCEHSRGGLRLPESARAMNMGLDRVLGMFDYSKYHLDMVKKRFGPRKSMVSRSPCGKEEMLLGSPQTDRLELREATVTGTFDLELDGRFSILIILEGSGAVTADGASLQVKKWTRVFLPAAVASAKLKGNLRVARCLPPRP